MPASARTIHCQPDGFVVVEGARRTAGGGLHEHDGVARLPPHPKLGSERVAGTERGRVVTCRVSSMRVCRGMAVLAHHF
jgi:hypothetical protein